MKAIERHLYKNNEYIDGIDYVRKETIKNLLTGKSVTTHYTDDGMEYIASEADYNLFNCMSNDTYTLRSYYRGSDGSTLGQLKSVEYFSGGKLSGEQLYYYKSGKKSAKLNYKNGTLDGDQYYYNNKTMEILSYCNDKCVKRIEYDEK